MKRLTLFCFLFCLLLPISVYTACGTDVPQTKAYTITFNTDGGNEVAPMEVKQGESYTLPVCTKENYKFLGWFIGDEKFESGTALTDNITLIAKWEKNKTDDDEPQLKTYTITFNTDGGSEVAPMEVKQGESYTLPVCTKENYKFLGWFIGDEKFESGTALTGNITLTAKWEKNKTDDDEPQIKTYTITFDTDGGSEVAPMEVKQGESYTLPDCTKEDYEFLGWFIGDEKFESGTALTGNITLTAKWEKKTAGAADFEWEESDGAIYIKKYIGTSASVSIPAEINGIKVIMIDVEAFKDRQDVTSVTIPEGVEYIQYRAFYNCVNLESINIPESVIDIQEEAFAGCGKISVTENDIDYVEGWAVDSSDDIVSAVVKDGTKGVGKAFGYRNSLQTVEIPDSVKFISCNAFTQCTSLKSVKLGNGISVIQNGTFFGCSALETLKIPNSVTSIRDGAFDDCSSLYDTEGGIRYVDGWAVNVKVSGGGKIGKNPVLREGTRGVAEGLFWFCKDLKTVTIPASVKYLGINLFEKYGNAPEIIYNGTSEEWEKIEKATNWNSGLSLTITYNGDDSES